MTNPEIIPTTAEEERWPAVESKWDPFRKEWNFLVRRPFYMNLRLGLTQNALWIGWPNTGGFRTIFNRLHK